jgi:AcrR family transcriptional regulator
LTTREIREPKQQRSIEKKNKIIKAGLELFSEKGYHNTNTAQIAKRAGVSTGIVYNYFADKKDIFIAVLDYLSTAITDTALSGLHLIEPDFQLDDAVQKVIDTVLDMHLSSNQAHEEIVAMSHLDPDVKDYIKKYEENLVEMLAKLLELHGYHISHPHEKLHVVYDMVENYCHAVLYHKHDCVDSSIMKDIIVKAIVNILK